MEIDKETYNHNMDYLYKINLWLLRKYGDELFEKFGVNKNNFSSVMQMFDAIYVEQCKEMPLPWYQYGFSSKE